MDDRLFLKPNCNKFTLEYMLWKWIIQVLRKEHEIWNALKDEMRRASTLTDIKTDQKTGWQSISLFNLQISFLLLFSFICIIIKCLFLLL